MSCSHHRGFSAMKAGRPRNHLPILAIKRRVLNITGTNASRGSVITGIVISGGSSTRPPISVMSVGCRPMARSVAYITEPF